MPLFHASLSFSAFDQWGWVEQFWRTDGSLTDALVAAQRLAAARFSLLGAGVTLYRVRVCQAGQPRACVSAPVTGQPLPVVAAEPIQALEVRLAGYLGRAFWRNYPLRGYPRAGIVGRGRLATWGPLLSRAGPAWLDLLVRDQWGLLIEQPVGPPQQLAGLALVALAGGDVFHSPVNVAAPDPATTLVYAQCAGPVAPGPTVGRVQGAQMTPRLLQVKRAVNGPHKLTALDGQGAYWWGDFGGGAYVGGGTIQFYQPNTVPISSWNTSGLVARKCGPAREPTNTRAEAAAAIAGPPGVVSTPGPPAIAPPSEVVVVNEYDSMLDMVQEVFAGYLGLPAPSAPLIGLAQVADRPTATYVVFLGGIDNEITDYTFQNWWTGLRSLVGVPDAYTDYVRKVLIENTPDGCEIIACGHSLGGMAAQSLTGFRSGLGSRRVVNVTGCGCPSFTYNFQGNIGFGLPLQPLDPLGLLPPVQNPRLFRVPLDPLPYLSPAGDWFWLRYLLLQIPPGEFFFLTMVLESAVAPQNITTISPPRDQGPNPFELHNCYPRCLDLVQYAWSGQYDPDGLVPALKTGAVQRFTYPPP